MRLKPFTVANSMMNVINYGNLLINMDLELLSVPTSFLQGGHRPGHMPVVEELAYTDFLGMIDEESLRFEQEDNGYRYEKRKGSGGENIAPRTVMNQMCFLCR